MQAQQKQYYRSINLPAPLVDTLEQLITLYPQYGFNSVAEVVKYSIRRWYTSTAGLNPIVDAHFAGKGVKVTYQFEDGKEIVAFDSLEK